MRTFPTAIPNEREALACVPVRLVPILCGVLAQLEARSAWASEEDYALGYQWIVELQANLMASCRALQTLIDEQRRTYRLLDAAFNGTIYATSTANNVVDTGYFGSVAGGELVYNPAGDGNDYTLISPKLPTAPPNYNVTPPIQPGMRQRLERIISSLDGGALLPPGDSVLEALRGATEAGGARNVLDKLDELLAEDNQELLDLIGQIIVLLG